MSGPETENEKTGKGPGRYMKLWPKRLLVAVIRTLLLVVFLCLAGLFLFYRTHRKELSEIFCTFVRSQAPRLFTPELTFSRVETVSLGHFIFYDPRIADPDSGGHDFVRAERVEVRFDPLHLLWRGVTLSRIEVHGGRFWIHRGEGGQGGLNWNGLFKSREEESQGPGTRIRFRRFLLDSCYVHLEDVDQQPVENEIFFMEGAFTRIAGENLIEVFGSSLSTSYWSFGRVKLTGLFTIVDGILSFRNTRVVRGTTDVTGDGFVDFAKQVFEYKIRPGRFELAHLPPELEMRGRLSGTADLSAILDGSFDSTAVSAEIHLDQGDLFGYPVDNFTCRLHYTAGRLRVSEIRSNAWGGEVRGDLEFRFGRAGEGYNMQGGVRAIKTAQLEIPGLNKLAGTLSGRFQLEGSGYEPAELALTGSARSVQGQFAGIDIDSSQVSFSYKDHRAKIDNFAVYSSGAVGTAIGEVGNKDMFLFILIENLPYQRVSRHLPFEGLTGICDFSGSLSGDPLNPRLKGSFTVEKGAYLKLQFEVLEGVCELSDLPGRTAGNVSVSFTDLNFAGRPFASLQAEGVVEPDGVVRFSPLTLLQDSLSSLRAFGTYRADSEKADSYLIRLDSLQLFYRGEQATSTGLVEILLTGDTTRVSAVELSAIGGTISGSLSFEGEEGVEADLEFNHLVLNHLPEALDRDINLRGILQGSLSLRGSLSEPVCDIKARVDSAVYSFLAVEKLETEAHLAAGRCRIDRLEMTQTGSTVKVTGTLPLNLTLTGGEKSPEHDSSLALQARLDSFPIAALKNPSLPFTDGSLEGNIAISGTLGRPTLEGEVRLTGGVGAIAPINARLKDMRGAFTFKPGVILVQNLNSKSPEGNITISGRIPLAGLMPDSLDLAITGRDLWVQQFKYVTSLKLDADLTMQGALDHPLLAGKIRVLRGEVNPLIGPTGGVSERQSPGQTVVLLPASPVDYDLTFTAAEDFWLRNRNASIKLTANLHAVQQDTVPQVTGRITTVTGFYSLYGRRFRIRYGSIQFQGQAALNPLLDINAERSVRGKVLAGDIATSAVGFRGSSGPTVPGEQYEVDSNTFYLHIGGTLNNPVFEIAVKDRDDREIEPPITEEQARTLVIFDQTFLEFQQQSSLSQSKLLDQAANLALNQANPYLQELTGIDEFSFESELFNRGMDQSTSSDRASARITMGEFLFESVYFSFSQDIIDPSARSAQIEYLINRNSSIISQTDSRGHFSIDYRYRIKY